jgi:MFS family permease
VRSVPRSSDVNSPESTQSRFDAAGHEAQPPARFERDSRHAWRLVVAAFISTFTLFGVAYSFGAFFRPMAAEFHADREAISAIFSITAFLYFMFGPITGHLADRFGPRAVVMTGAIAMGVGLIATAGVHHLWAAYITYGLGLGIGVACCYVPLVSAVSGWFLRRRNTALGVAVSGIGAGTLAVAPLAAELIRRLGWRRAYVILGFAAAAVLMLCAYLAEPAPAENEGPRAMLGHTLRKPDFVLLYSAGFLWSIATAVPFVFLTPYAQGRGIGQVSAAALVGVIGFASTAGRLGLGALADRMGILRLYRACVLALGLSYAIWWSADSWTGLALFALAMGISYGGAVTLTPAVVAELFGTQGLGAILGALYTSSAIATLVGPPLCGAIIDRTGSYRFAIGLTLVSTVAAFFVLLPVGMTPAVAADAEAD